MKTVTCLKWVKVAPGRYTHTGWSGRKYEAERLAPSELDRNRRDVWFLRVDGQVTDRERTLRILQLFVEHYEAEARSNTGKPLIDIL